MQAGGPVGVRLWRPVPALGGVRRRLPGGSPAPRRGQGQLPDGREPGPAGPRGERAVPVPRAAARRGAEERAGPRGGAGPRAVLAQRRVFRRVVPLREARVQNGRGAPHRETAVQVDVDVLPQGPPRAGVSELGGRDHGEEEKRSDWEGGGGAGAGWTP